MAGNQPLHLTFAAGEALLRRLRNWPAGFYKLALTSGGVRQIEVKGNPPHLHCCVLTLYQRPGLPALASHLDLFLPFLVSKFSSCLPYQAQSNGLLRQTGLRRDSSRADLGMPTGERLFGPLPLLPLCFL